MKKILLSLTVIATFVINALYQRFEQPDDTKVVVVPSLSTNASAPTSNPEVAQLTRGQYKDGQYTGDVTDAYYGNVQVQVVINGGKITDVVFLRYPNDRRTSITINTQAMPYLRQEAIQAQHASVDIVSGATQTSLAFKQSLQSALDKAKIKI